MTKRERALPNAGPEKVQARHDFTPEEWRDASNRHLNLLGEIAVAKDQRKAAAEAAKARIGSMQADAGELAEALRKGYSLEEVDALVVYDAKECVKRYFVHKPGHPEHDTFVKQEPMSEEDFQFAQQNVLPLEDERKAKEKGEGGEQAGPEPPKEVA